MNKSKNPLRNFLIYSFAVHIAVWVLFCLYDYGIDEGNWVDDNFGLTVWTCHFAMLAVSLLVPIVSFICLRERFSSDRPIKTSAMQILIWCVSAVVVSLPVIVLQDMDKWIIKQSNRSGGAWIDLNGLEYYGIPIAQAICAVLLVIKLIAASVKKKTAQSKK